MKIITPVGDRILLEITITTNKEEKELWCIEQQIIRKDLVEREYLSSIYFKDEDINIKIIIDLLEIIKINKIAVYLLSNIDEILKNLIQVDEEDYDYLLDLIYEECLSFY